MRVIFLKVSLYSRNNILFINAFLRKSNVDGELVWRNKEEFPSYNVY